MLPYYAEQQPMSGLCRQIRREHSYVDPGWRFLTERNLSATLPPLMLAGALAAENRAISVQRCATVDKRPYPSFVKAYGHNGYSKSLKSVVHFYNTRDVLQRCGQDLGRDYVLACARVH